MQHSPDIQTDGVIDMEKAWKNRLQKAMLDIDKYPLNEWCFIYHPLTMELWNRSQAQQRQMYGDNKKK